MHPILIAPIVPSIPTLTIINNSVQFAHKTMKPDANQLYTIFKAWKDAVDKISDVEGLYPTFVMNPVYASSATPANTNGIGNVWGLSDDQSYISKSASIIIWKEVITASLKLT